MNDVLKNILKVAEAVAASSVPGGAAVDAAVHNIVEHKGAVDSNVLDAAEAAIQVVEAIKGTDIADEVKFRAGCATLDAGFKLVRESLTDHSDGTPQAAA